MSLHSLIRSVYGVETDCPLLDVPECVDRELSILDMCKIIAVSPPNSNFLIVGPVGIGKTSILYRLGREIASALGREFVDLSIYSTSWRDALEVIRDVWSRPGRYFVYSYMKGSDITRTSYAVPINLFLSLDELEKLSSSGQAQGWAVPPHVLALSVRPEMVRRFISENPSLEPLLYRAIHGEVRLVEPSIVRKMLPYFPLGMLVIDEALQAFDDFLNHYVQGLVGERHWMMVKLSPLVRIVLITNPHEYNRAVGALPEPVLRRVRVLKVRQASIDEVWSYIEETCREMKLTPPSIVYTLMRMLESYLLAPPSEAEKSSEMLEPYPTPAGWAEYALEVARVVNGKVSADLREYMVLMARMLLSPKIASLIRQVLNMKLDVDPRRIVSDPETLRNVLLDHSYESDVRSKCRLYLALYLACQHASTSEEAMREFGTNIRIVLDSLGDGHDKVLDIVKNFILPVLRIELESKWGCDGGRKMFLTFLNCLGRYRTRIMF